MSIGKAQQVAVIGAGIAGAACARALSLAGRSVHVFDKSRGPGGRLATRLGAQLQAEILRLRPARLVMTAAGDWRVLQAVKAVAEASNLPRPWMTRTCGASPFIRLAAKEPIGPWPAPAVRGNIERVMAWGGGVQPLSN